MHYKIEVADRNETRIVGFGEGTYGDAFRLFGFEVDRAIETVDGPTWIRLLIDGMSKIGLEITTGSFVRYSPYTGNTI